MLQNIIKQYNDYYKVEKNYLKVAKLYNHRYYYDFDKVTKHIKYVKLNKLSYVHDDKNFNDQNSVNKLKIGTKVKVNKIVRYCKINRFNIGQNQFITGIKSFIYKLTK